MTLISSARLCVMLAAASLALTACQPAPAPAPVLPGDTPVTIGTQIVMDSAIYGAPRTITVSLPASYGDGAGRSFPVLYVVDGGVAQDFVPMAGMAALAGLTRQYREFILVGVQTENRYLELTAPSQLENDLRWIPENGGASQYREHLLDEVKPYIEARYRTSGEDAIIGESMAGLFIAETFLRAPDSFDHYIAVSPSLWWRGEGLSHEAADLLAAGGFGGHSLYLTIADEGEDMQTGMDRLVAALEAGAPEDLTWWYQPMPDEHHNTIYNPAALRALRLTFATEED
ncbi:alpha/beta hydrolase-fold protein [uncultured Maricaulis sp.]|uniref:alpha/beta hydrolase n=1 Tax=uncultured Maricaulis sp. TaxID=174710 RepID=UPI0030D99EF6|tara:strand:+ start:5352 stop:6212 length:861 start_codon:yes stop_codon:yes gene_type:complete